MDDISQEECMTYKRKAGLSDASQEDQYLKGRQTSQKWRRNGQINRKQTRDMTAMSQKTKDGNISLKNIKWSKGFNYVKRKCSLDLGIKKSWVFHQNKFQQGSRSRSGLYD